MSSVVSKKREESLKVTCKFCGIVLKRKAYYLKHLRNLHAKDMEGNKASTSEKCGSTAEEKTEQEPDDCWDSYEDPEVHLDYDCEENSDDESTGKESVKDKKEDKVVEKETKVEAENILLGRTIRKATTPALPGKRRISEDRDSAGHRKDQPENSVEKVKQGNIQSVVEPETADEPAESLAERNTDPAKELSLTTDQRKRKVSLTFDREIVGQKKRQKLTLTENGEVNYESAVTCPVNRNMVPVEFNLSEFVEDGVASISDIGITISETGELTVNMIVK